MNNMKKKVIISSIMTIVICLTLIAGSTFALFTDSDKVNVAVTAGTVDVKATPENIAYTSSLNNMVLPESNYTLNGNEFTVQYMVPGDTLEFDLAVENESTVSVDYRPVVAVSADDGLWNGLVVTFTVDNETLNYTLVNGAWYGDYAELPANATVHVSVTLPEAAGNEYQGKSCKFAFTIEAIQANHDGQ